MSPGPTAAQRVVETVLGFVGFFVCLGLIAYLRPDWQTTAILMLVAGLCAFFVSRYLVTTYVKAVLSTIADLVRRIFGRD